MKLSRNRNYWRSIRDANAFSLVEVALALGILSFCMIAILGLIPTGLNALKTAQEQSRAVSTLNMVTTAVRSITPDLTSPTKYYFPSYLNDSTTPIGFSIGDTPSTYTFIVDEDGSIHQSGSSATSAPRQTLYLNVIPPKTANQPVQVYADVAWPVRPTIDKKNMTVDKLVGREGYVDTFITYALRN